MNRFKLLLTLCFLVTTVATAAQRIRKAKTLVGKQTVTYLSLVPEGDVTGLLILLPGWGESPESIFQKTQLPHTILKEGFITIVPQLTQSLFADDQIEASLTLIVKQQWEIYQLLNPPLFIGGLSAGGAVALGYAQRLVETNSQMNLQGVFAIDPPLDLARVFASAERKIKYSCNSKLISKEGKLTRRYLVGSMGGTPSQKPDQYLRYSVYFDGSNDRGRAQFLKNIPVRLYSEPDLHFVKKTYCDELKYEDLNAYDLDKLSTYLSSIGNKKAEHITTTERGFHSWNILNAENAADWIRTIIQKL